MRADMAAVSPSKTGRGQVTVPMFLLVPQVEAAEAARSGTGCGSGARRNSRVDRDELA